MSGICWGFRILSYIYVVLMDFFSFFFSKCVASAFLSMHLSLSSKSDGSLPSHILFFQGVGGIIFLGIYLLRGLTKLPTLTALKNSLNPALDRY